MAQIEILSESDTAHGWVFSAQALDDHGRLTHHEMTLSWADYNLWSVDGTDEPAKVAEAVMIFLCLRLRANEVPAKFDASLARRRFSDADAVIPKLIA